MHELIERVFLPAFGESDASRLHDGATITADGRRMAFSTDSYVVDPLFFPGGDIGSLAVNGTVNDLAMCGARPLYLSAGFVIEEGLPVSVLQRIVRSMGEAARRAEVRIITGDTKVVDRGKGHGVFINTAGVGVVDHDLKIGPGSVETGDMIILSRDIGCHGIAVMAEREGLSFETTIESDCAGLVKPVLALIDGGVRVRCLRDLTRGGLATALVEIGEASGRDIVIDESSIVVRGDVRAACEILGLDPLYVANEGAFVAFVAADDVSRATEIMRDRTVSQNPQVIGEVVGSSTSTVAMRTRLGSERILDMLGGEQLPRIC